MIKGGEVISCFFKSCETATLIACILQGHVLANALFESHTV